VVVVRCETATELAGGACFRRAYRGMASGEGAKSSDRHFGEVTTEGNS
jgi:hypothetical protein